MNTIEIHSCEFVNSHAWGSAPPRPLPRTPIVHFKSPPVNTKGVYLKVTLSNSWNSKLIQGPQKMFSLNKNSLLLNSCKEFFSVNQICSMYLTNIFSSPNGSYIPNILEFNGHIDIRSQSVSQLVSQSVSQLVSQPVSQLVSQSVSQLVSQSVTQLASQSVSHLVSQSERIDRIDIFYF